MDATLQKIAEIVLDIGYFSLDKWMKHDFTVRQNTERKGETMDFDAIDGEINIRMAQALRALGITDRFLTEEGKKNSTFNASGGLRWVCDELDGTSNFSAGEPDWGHSIALEDNGAIQYAAVFLPARGELLLANGTNAYFLNTYGKTAEEIKTAILTVPLFRLTNSQYLLPQTVETAPLKRIRCYIHPGRKRNFELSAHNPINRLYAEVANPACSFSCVSALAKVAIGKLDAAVIGFQNYWDFAASRLILQNVGAHFGAFAIARNLDGPWPRTWLTSFDCANASVTNREGAEWQCHIIAAKDAKTFFALSDFMTA
jgi:fructose-1,6-bisphosphatase/inositol monophosphatase family enzyme